jgi:bla regulator protein BlaR1
LSQRNNSILKSKTIRRGTAVMMLILIICALTACKAAAGSNPPRLSPVTTSLPPSAVEPPSVSAEDSNKEKRLELAKTWAEAVKNRDGKEQYALYTANLQNDLTDVYEGLNWVTGTSSPWVESYTAELTKSGATVTFAYAASTGPAGEYEAQLQFAEEDGALKISGITNLELILGDIPPISGTGASPAPDDK